LPVPKPRHLSSPRQTTHESGVLLREALGEQLRPRVDGGRSRAGARRPHSPHSTQPAPRRCTARADPPSPPLEEHVAPPCFVTSLHPRQHRVVCAPAPPMHALLARSGAHTTPTLHQSPLCIASRAATAAATSHAVLLPEPVAATPTKSLPPLSSASKDACEERSVRSAASQATHQDSGNRSSSLGVAGVRAAGRTVPARNWPDGTAAVMRLGSTKKHVQLGVAQAGSKQAPGYCPHAVRADAGGEHASSPEWQVRARKEGQARHGAGCGGAWAGRKDTWSDALLHMLGVVGTRPS
jgi:hypothetical protein